MLRQKNKLLLVQSSIVIEMVKQQDVQHFRKQLLKQLSLLEQLQVADLAHGVQRAKTLVA